MDSRLDDLDDEFDRAEAELRELDKQLSQRYEPPTPAPRFQEPAVSAGASPCDFNTAQAHDFASRAPRAQRFSRAARCPPAMPGEGAFSCVSPHSAPQRSLRAGTSSASRWGPPPDARRVVVKVKIADGAALGLVLDKRCTDGTCLVLSVKPGSVLAEWNAVQLELGQPEQCVQAGDAILEVNGGKVRSIDEFRRALANAPSSLRLVFRCNPQGPRLPAAVGVGSPALTKPRVGNLRQAAPVKSTTAPAAARVRASSVPGSNNAKDAYRELCAAGVLPGRFCRGGDLPKFEVNTANSVARHTEDGGVFFGTEQRFAKGTPEQGPALGCPDDQYLSNRPSARSAVIPPVTPEKRRLKKVGGAVAFAAVPGLRGHQSSWIALTRDVLQEDEEASTEAGSELGSGSSVWSSCASETPGPGAYSPDFAAAGPPATARGTPSFGRYTAREPVKRLVVETSVAESETPSAAPAPPAVVPTRGGFIAASRRFEPESDEIKQAAKRPFYEVKHSLVEEACKSTAFLPENTSEGRLHQLKKGDALGPGCYEIPVSIPDGPSTIILPLPKPIDAPKRNRPTSPGPADYDDDRAMAVLMPRLTGSQFGQAQGHGMEFQKVPKYTTLYKPLDPRWEALRRGSLSVVIPPSHQSHALLRQFKFQAGPGSYETDATAAHRIRADVHVQQWGHRRRHPGYEHGRGLYTDHPVDLAVRGDPRLMLSADADLLLRRQPKGFVMRARSASPVLMDRRWRLYDPHPAPRPEGLANFARCVSFEDFKKQVAIWNARHELALQRNEPNTRLAYSLPSLEITKPRAYAGLEFDKVPGRPASDPGDDEPREGDVLILSDHAERDLFHPRAPAFVDMRKQLGRPDPNGAQDETDDFEELILSPRPVQKRTPMYVDMSKGAGRPEQLDLSAHLWADDNGILFVYQPTAGLRLRDEYADELDLSPLRADGKLRLQARSADFSRALGRVGVDPRLPAPEPDPEEEVVLTNWKPRFRSRAGRSRSPSPDGGPSVFERLTAGMPGMRGSAQHQRGRQRPDEAATAATPEGDPGCAGITDLPALDVDMAGGLGAGHGDDAADTGSAD